MSLVGQPPAQSVPLEINLELGGGGGGSQPLPPLLNEVLAAPVPFTSLSFIELKKKLHLGTRLY